MTTQIGRPHVFASLAEGAAVTGPVLTALAIALVLVAPLALAFLVALRLGLSEG